MKLYVALFVLLNSILIAFIAGGVSVYGMTLIFGGHAIIVGLLIGSIEFGKLTASCWLKLNWNNKTVPFLHKSYLLGAITLVMLLTAIGSFGFLSSAHLEQKAPLAGLEVQSSQFQTKIDQKNLENQHLQQRLNQIDENISVFLKNDQASRGLRASQSLQKERDQIQKKIDVNDNDINNLDSQLAPLKTQTNEVEAKLGPVKYVAALLGWKDTEAAVRLVIMIIMVAFDPLAIVLMLSGLITLREWYEEGHPSPEPEEPLSPDTPEESSEEEEPAEEESAEETPEEPAPVVTITHPEDWAIEPDHEIVAPPIALDVQDVEDRSDYERSDMGNAVACDFPDEEPVKDKALIKEMDRETLLNILERNPGIVNEIEAMVEKNVEQELTDREKLLDLLEKNPSIINDMAEIIAAQITKEGPSGESWLK